AVSGVLAQRLARTLCSNCAESYRPGEEELLAARVPHERMGEFMEREFKRKVGCARCGQTGYRGRIGVFQFLPMSESVSRLAPHTTRSPKRRAPPACARSGTTASTRSPPA